MIKRFYPVKLHFDVSVEYSKDNGVTWLTLAADTPIEINPEELPSNGRVKIRTAENIETLDPAKLEFDSRLFSAVNIKNGRTLTNTNALFKKSIINTVRVANIPSLTSATEMFREGIFDNVIMGYAPSLLDATNFMNLTSVKAFDGIRLPVCELANSMFYKLKNNSYMGDIVFDSPVSVTAAFSYANINVMPYVEINGLKDSGTHAPSSNLFSYLNTPYILYSLLNFSGLSNYDSRLMSDSPIKFSGIDLKVDLGAGNNHVNFFSNCPNLTYPWSRMIKTYGSMRTAFTNSTNITTDLTVSERARIENTNEAYVISELPNWLPEIIELESFENIDNIVGFKTTNAIGLNIIGYKIVSGSLYKYSTLAIDNYNTATYSKELEPTLTEANKVVYSRNGSYAIQDGADIKVYNGSGGLISTIAGVTVKSMNLNQNASKLYVVTGSSFDALNMNHQTINNSVLVYNVSSASLETTFAVTLEQDEEVAGVYCASDDSNVNIVKTKWHVFDAAEMHQRMLSSSIDSYKTLGGIKYSVNITYPVNLVTNHHVEDNEFNCLDTINGKIVRMFSK